MLNDMPATLTATANDHMRAILVKKALERRSMAHTALTSPAAQADTDCFRDWTNELDYQNRQLAKLGYTC